MTELDDLERPRRAVDGDDVDLAPDAVETDETEPDRDGSQDAALDDAELMRLSHAHEADSEDSASDLAYGEPTRTTAMAATPTAKPRRKPTSSHDGGFTGFGAQFQPYTYTDPRENHGKLDPKVRRLGAQYVRVFVPLGAVTSGLLGAAGHDYGKENIEHLEAALQNNPGDAGLEKRLANARKQYAQDQSYTRSFLKTLALAGKHTTINLTFSGSVGHHNRIDGLAQVIAYLVQHGYDRLQVTLENEPNGPDDGDGFRGRFNRGINNHNRKAADAATKEYVDAYEHLNEELAEANVRDDVSIIGGDMVANKRAAFFESITRQGMNELVDGYSFHTYWGAGSEHRFGKALKNLSVIKKLAAKYAKGKPISITEYGKQRYATKAERDKDPHHKGVVAQEKGESPAFEQGLYALSAVNLGYAGMVKWDAFYGGEHHKGDGKGDPGRYWMIGGPGADYGTDETYRLMRMFTHATEPGWRVHGQNHGEQGCESHFLSADGAHGAVLAMSKKSHAVAMDGLPKGKKVYVTVWNRNGKGDLHTHVVAPGHRQAVQIPENGAVAISTKPFGV